MLRFTIPETYSKHTDKSKQKPSMIDNFVCLSTVNSLLHCYLALCKLSTQQADS